MSSVGGRDRRGSSVEYRGVPREAAGGRRLTFLHSQNDDGEETLTTDSISVYSNDSVKNQDGRFFECFSSVHHANGFTPLRTSEGDVTDGTAARYAGNRRPTLSEDLLEAIKSMEDAEKKEMSKKGKELLYVELLYTIQHKIGAESQTMRAEAMIEELYTYGRKAFGVTDEQHNHLLSITNRAKPPVLVLNVGVDEARNLEAKDADAATFCEETFIVNNDTLPQALAGFSDPYCMLGIIPGSRAGELPVERNDATAQTSKAKSLLRKLSGSFRDKWKTGSKSSSTSSVYNIPAKFIQSTKVISNSLNPVWNENFKFDIEDAKTDKIHIDVWDHDDEESVFDAAKTLNKAKTIKGLGRVFKQIAQSARTSSGENVDDFLGSIDIPLHDVPSTGYSCWYDLCGRSAKSRVHGEIKISLSLATREDRGMAIDDNFNDVQQHEDLLLTFIEYERQTFSGRSGDWSGQLSTEAEIILHQHSVQGDITPAQEAFSYWITFSKKFREAQFDTTCLWNILRSLEDKWSGGSLSGEEEARLGKSFKQFMSYFLDLMVEIRDLYPAEESGALRKLEVLVECVQFLITSSMYKHCCPTYDDINTEISSSLKNGTKSYFSRTLSAICQKSKVEKSVRDKVLEMTQLTNLLLADVHEGLEQYHPLFDRILHIPYFDPVYRVLERKLSTEVRRLLDEDLSSLLLSSEVSAVNEARRCSNQSMSGREPPSTPESDARKLLISSVLNLYFCTQRFADLKKHLIVVDPQTLLVSRYQEWFSRIVQEWLTISKAKLEARIRLAVQHDKFVNVGDNFECSTSAVDVVNCYTQIADFWKRLDWENEEELFAFSLKLTDDICQSAILYTDLLHTKMQKNSYFDDDGQFDVHKPLCTCLNDLEYIRRTVIELPTTLNLKRVVSAIEQRHSVASETGDTTHFNTVFQSLVNTALSTMENKIEYISQKVSDRMRQDIKKNVFHLCWSPEKNSIQEAIEPLIDYLDDNLLTLHTYLLRRNFKSLLSAIWEECLEELQEVLKSPEETNSLLLTRILQSLEVLVDFFNANNNGLLMSEITNNSLYTGMMTYLTVQKLSTEEIICQFFQDMVTFQSLTKLPDDNKLGVIGFRTQYDRTSQTLHVEVNYCNDIIALDSNGLSDPYIIWDLCPRFMFKHCTEYKTTIKKKTLNPIYNEEFQCNVSLEDLQQDGACLRFTLMDYNFVVKNDFGGEAYIATTNIPGVNSLLHTKGFTPTTRPTELVFMKPQSVSENPNLVALTKRTTDHFAQEFVNTREELAEIAQTKIEEYKAMHHPKTTEG